MEEIYIKETLTTPEVVFKPEEGYLELKGASYPEYTEDFYRTLIEGIDRYTAEPMESDKTTIALKLTYFNTGTNTVLSNMFKLFEKLHQENGHDVIILWYYEEEDEDMKELGDYFKSYTSLSFEFVIWENEESEDTDFDLDLED